MKPVPAILRNFTFPRNPWLPSWKSNPLVTLHQKDGSLSVHAETPLSHRPDGQPGDQELGGRRTRKSR